MQSGKDMNLCHVCGNQIESSVVKCPFCGCTSGDSALPVKKDYVHRVVNLETGRPGVETAMERMGVVIEDGVRTGVSVLTLIHGYGSSGKGGVIRKECRKNLDFMKSRGRISDYITGEAFNKKSGVVKTLLRRYPQLISDRNLNRGNRGITLVVI